MPLVISVREKTDKLLCRNRHEQKVRTRTMKIVDMMAPRFRDPPGHGVTVRCFPKCFRLLIRRGDASSGAAAFIANSIERKKSKNHICLMQCIKKNFRYDTDFHPLCVFRRFMSVFIGKPLFCMKHPSCATSPVWGRGTLGYNDSVLF